MWLKKESHKSQKICVISLTQGGRHADNTVDLQEFMIMP
ncbi:MAG: hypothetical protein ACI4EI_04425, partial [Muricoprocola sp.]